MENNLRFYAGAPSENKIAEMDRFNQLSEESAIAILKQMDGRTAVARSCWYCNSSHDHLRDLDVPILCVSGCGMHYLKGFPARVVFLRSKGQEITEYEMSAFEAVLADAE